jgi:SAM-dependent methyltransferase
VASTTDSRRRRCDPDSLAKPQSPEELDERLEDALLLGDTGALATLFEEDAVLMVERGRLLRGDALVSGAPALLAGGTSPYMAAPQHVVQVGDLAVVPSSRTINVARRAPGGGWRFVMVALIEGVGLMPGEGAARMETAQLETAVSAHYTAGDLGRTLLEGLRAAGKDPDNLRLDDLIAVDQLHAGGAGATRKLMARARLAPGLQVLDIGGGLGGPARLIAHETGCTVTVLDLSEEFCRVGRMLTERVGQSDSVSFQHGSALKMPFPDHAFDRAWTQHATMNIADKRQLFTEVRRVLRPGGLLVLHEVMAGSADPLHLPVPWATDTSINFLLTSEQFRTLLSDLGYREKEWVEERDMGAIGGPPAGTGQEPSGPPLAARLLFGPQMAEMVGNVVRNLLEGRLVHAQAVFERP